MPDKPRYLFETKDRLGQIVRLTTSNFDNHLKTHPEIGDYVEEAKLTVEQPNIVFESDNGSVYYYRSGLTRGKFRACYVLVIVRCDKIAGTMTAEGQVATFDLTTKIANDGELTWIRPDIVTPRT